MKKILYPLFFALTIILTNAQTAEHLLFKGIPINGTLHEFVAKLKQDGFTHIKTEDGIALLRGDFASYKDCAVGVVMPKESNVINKVAVIFPSRDNWSALSENYFNLQEMLTEKYGEPALRVEKFTSYEPKDDGSKLTQVHLDACKYITIYDTDNGSIELSIKGDISSAYVLLSYFDKTNSNKIREKAKEDL